MFTKASNNLFGILVAFISSLVVLSLGLTNPAYNWDMIGYVASALHRDGYQGESLLLRTYSVVKTEVSEAVFNELTQGEYRDTVSKDPEALTQQLPFYSIRVIYVELIRLMHSFGMNYAKATYIISAISAFIAMFILAGICSHQRIPLFAAPFVAFSAGLFEIARISTPDALATLVALAAIYLLLKEKYLPVVMNAALLPLIRTDYIILSFLLCAIIYFYDKKRSALSGLALALIFYFCVNEIHGNYGWLTIFNFTLINITPYPEFMKPSKDLLLYVYAYIRGFQQLINHRHFIIYGITAFVITKTLPLSKDDKNLHALLIIPLCFSALHFILFPAYFARFYVFPVSLIIIWLIRELRESLHNPPPDRVR